MEFYEEDPKKINSKGAPIFKKMLEDKRMLSEHYAKGGSFEEIKNKLNFGKPLQYS